MELMDEYSILRKKRKKNGFAATSLLISIAIALLVLVGAVLILGKVDNGINKVNDDSNMTLGSGVEMTCAGLTKEMVFNTNIRYMKEAAISYFTNERLPKKRGEVVKMTLKEMKDKHLILNVIDSTYKLCADNDSYVEVMKATNEYVMKIMLSCNDMEDYLIVHLGCYDYCDRDVCEKQEPEKEYEYEYKKTTACTMNPWSAWGNWKLTREKTSNLKKEDTKVEIVNKDTVYKTDAIANKTYNCDAYPGYKKVGALCVKDATVIDTKEATKDPDTYNCKAYPGYTVKNGECVKDIQTQLKKDATTYNCDKYSKDYVLKDNKCVRKAVTIAAAATQKTRTVTKTKTCYKEICVTQMIYSCPTENSCGTQPVNSCQKVEQTCEEKVTEKYNVYTCPEGYTKSQKDGKYVCTLPKDTKDATKVYDCKKYEKDGYKLDGKYCIKNVTTQDKQPAEKNPETYNCKAYPGYELQNKTCVKISAADTKNATEITNYTCPLNYKQNGKTCTLVVPANTKVTYYRYATRTCTGGSVSVKWSTSNNDSILISEGYKPTGVKRALTVTEK